ncbi:MAG: AAA family ATPase [candidate division WOR-3 bacterium]
MEECKFCGYNKILASYEYCPNCGALFRATESVVESEHVKLWGGESRIVTLFFVNFIAPRAFDDPIKARQNAIYLAEIMNDIEKLVIQHGGSAYKIIPDNRILVVFGIPRASKEDLEHAIECVIAVREYCLHRMDRRDFGDWHTTYGVNTGWVFFGYIVKGLSYLTIIGDTVNVAARIAQICPLDQIFISDAVYERISHLVDAEFIGERILKGRAQPVRLYKLNQLLKEKRKPAVSRFPLLGREQEFARLIKALDTVKKRKVLKVFAITGQMGIGKTRLKEEFREYLRKQEDLQVYESYCALEIHSPYYPFKFFFREIMGITEIDDVQKIIYRIDKFVRENGLTEQDAQGLRYLFTADTRRIREERLHKIQEEIFSAVKNTLSALACKKPLVLIFEEFNRVDNLSRMLVYFLTQKLADQPIFILMVNFIPDTEFKFNLPVETIALNPLSFESVYALIKFVLDSDVDEHLADFVFRISGGNPLFVIETIRNIKRTQMIKKDDKGKWFLEREKRLPFLDDLYGVVMSGVDSLPASYRLLIDYAAVIGYSFTRKIIAGLLSDVTDIEERLTYLAKEDYIVQFRDGDDPVYIFRHNLLRDAVYTTLPMKKRKEIHKRVADLIEDKYQTCLTEYFEILAQQFLGGEEFKKAAHYFRLSGYKAKTLYSIESAINFFNIILRITEEHPEIIEEDLVLDALLNLCDLYEIKGDIQRMKSVAELGQARASKLNLKNWHLSFLERLATAFYLLNEYPKAEELFINAIESCNNEMSEVLTALYTGLGILYQAKNEPEKSLLNYNLAWVTARSNNYQQGEYDCLLNLSRMHILLGNYELSLEYLNYALNELLNEEEILEQSEVKYLMGEIYYQIGNYDWAENYFRAAFDLTRQFGFEISLRSILALTVLMSLRGDETGVKNNLDFIDKNLPLFVRDNLLAEINLKKGFVFKNLREEEKAAVFLNNALKLIQKIENRELEFWCHLFLADLAEIKALDYLKKALDIGEMLKYPPLIAHALYKLALYYQKQGIREQANYYGRKALYILDDIKNRLNPENRKYFGNKTEYVTLLEM